MARKINIPTVDYDFKWVDHKVNIDIDPADEILSGPMDEIIERIRDIFHNASNVYPDGHLYLKPRFYGYDGGFDLELFVKRKEQDFERDARVEREEAKRDAALARKAKAEAKEREALAADEEKERALYIHLKEKYGD